MLSNRKQVECREMAWKTRCVFVNTLSTSRINMNEYFVIFFFGSINDAKRSRVASTNENIKQNEI